MVMERAEAIEGLVRLADLAEKQRLEIRQNLIERLSGDTSAEYLIGWKSDEAIGSEYVAVALARALKQVQGGGTLGAVMNQLMMDVASMPESTSATANAVTAIKGKAAKTVIRRLADFGLVTDQELAEAVRNWF